MNGFGVRSAFSGSTQTSAFSGPGVSYWVAYGTNQTGRAEIFVAPFPETGERTLVSTAGGLLQSARSRGEWPTLLDAIGIRGTPPGPPRSQPSIPLAVVPR